MRAAPAVRALASGNGPWRWTQCLLHAAAAASLFGWAGAWWFDAGPAAALAAMLAAPAAGALAWRSTRPQACWLVWDGSVWTAEPPAGPAWPGRLRLMLDLGDWMLVRLMPEAPGARRAARALWLPLSRREVGASWHGLRTAVHAMPAAPTSPELRRLGAA